MGCHSMCSDCLDDLSYVAIFTWYIPINSNNFSFGFWKWSRSSLPILHAKEKTLFCSHKSQQKRKTQPKQSIQKPWCALLSSLSSSWLFPILSNNLKGWLQSWEAYDVQEFGESLSDDSNLRSHHQDHQHHHWWNMKLLDVLLLLLLVLRRLLLIPNLYSCLSCRPSPKVMQRAIPLMISIQTIARKWPT